MAASKHPETYVARTSAVVGLKDGSTFIVSAGRTILSGDHEVVKTYPQFFVPAADVAK